MIKIYKVGGCVRDAIMNVPFNDIDYSVEAPSFEAMRDYIQERGKIWLESPQYNTIRGRINGEDVDFVLCRKDGEYTDGRRPDSVEMGTIYDDLARRDFTMNAIAADEFGNILDPYDGQQAIADKRIECVGKTEDRFNEDALRILRAFRFSVTKCFTLSTDIQDAMRDFDIVGQLKNVSEDRIRIELNKCFAFDTLYTMELFEEFPVLRGQIFNNTNMWLQATSRKK